MKEKDLYNLADFFSRHPDLLSKICAPQNEAVAETPKPWILNELEIRLRNIDIPYVVRIIDRSMWQFSYFGSLCARNEMEKYCGEPLLYLLTKGEEICHLGGSLVDEADHRPSSNLIDSVLQAILKDWENVKESRYISIINETIQSIVLSEDDTSLIITTKSFHIVAQIDNYRLCCEDYGGFLVCEDSYDSFVGKTLRNIVLTDTLLITKTLVGIERFGGVEEDSELGSRVFSYDFDGEKVYSFPEIVFINFETDAGVLQFAVYNYHNGYYGHDVSIKINNHEMFKTVL